MPDRSVVLFSEKPGSEAAPWRFRLLLQCAPLLKGPESVLRHILWTENSLRRTLA